MPRVLRVALTGGIATGKSHVRREFETLGVPAIDADTLAREAVEPGTYGLEAVVRRFGPGVLEPSGALDRSRLGEIVFADADARKDLEAIIHPLVRAATEHFFQRIDASEHPFAIAEIPLLYEVGRDRDFDVVIVVAVDAATQVKRMMERDGLSEAEARQRLAAQLPISEKVVRAPHVIDTGGSYESTAQQVREVFDHLRKSG